MESVVDEFVFIVGPVLVTFLSTTGHATSRRGHRVRPRRRRQPAVRRPAPHRAAARSARAPQRPVGDADRRGCGCCSWSGAAVGAILGTLEIALVAFADAGGRASRCPASSSPAWPSGSMASGIGWGTVHWRLPLRRRLAAVLVLLTVLSVPLLARPRHLGDGPVRRARRGVAVSPSLISSFTLAELLVPRAAVTEAFTWIGTALGPRGGGRRLGGGQDRRRRRRERELPRRHHRGGARGRHGGRVPAVAARARRARHGAGARPLRRIPH